MTDERPRTTPRASASGERSRRQRRPDPCTLVYAAPAVDIDGGEDWRASSVESWLVMAGHEGFDVSTTQESGSPSTRDERATWCGNVLVLDPDLPDVAGMVYRVHRGPRRRMLIGAESATGDPMLQWAVIASVYVVPALDGDPLEVWQPR
jgi:hypothetical protein